MHHSSFLGMDIIQNARPSKKLHRKNSKHQPSRKALTNTFDKEYQIATNRLSPKTKSPSSRSRARVWAKHGSFQGGRSKLQGRGDSNSKAKAADIDALAMVTEPQ
ncbi:hypothetical protein H6P81_018705 [Aristolochia fimbriata]|uniref:Uncharacterized protein n=1 Tax=Aristolochia fimbriata TaxID=158543 RepID=A0AAV7E3B8_ARIFI|nr:hypothetical protein H6P81_018705 [Aristolochia fimbriata]